MPMYFRLGNPAITSVSIDGRSHTVNDDGVLEVHEVSQNLIRELRDHYGARPHNPGDPENSGEKMPQQTAEEEIERTSLFEQLDTVTGRRTDRRRSLPQLREQWADYQKRQASTVGASKTLNPQVP